MMDVELTQNDGRTWGGEEDSEPDVQLLVECGSGGVDQKEESTRRGEKRVL
jgi:hypothetical protein